MGLIVIGLVLVGLFLWWLTSEPTTSQQRSMNQDDSYLSSMRDGHLVQEQDTCNGCAHNRAEELRSQGYTVEEHLGRRNSGNL